MKIIKVNETFSISRDPRNWILTTSYPSKDREGNPSIGTIDTYYGNLPAVCEAIIDRQAGLCGSLEEILSMLKDAKHGLLKSI